GGGGIGNKQNSVFATTPLKGEEGGSPSVAKGSNKLTDLGLLLIRRACANEEIANFLFWYLKLEVQVRPQSGRPRGVRQMAES
ncbi:unnamed protein product, partial [Discosporangium mesarthrocarpum]